MKKLLKILVLFLVLTSVTLFGCSNNNQSTLTLPASNALVVSNGGTAVQKGDYLYFINGFYSLSNIDKGDNHWGDFGYQGAIYRTKLTNLNLLKDSDGFLTNAELIVPKLVGYENGGFYIYGDYIYYSTPNNGEDRNGNTLKNKTDYYRVNLDGKNNVLVYSSNTDSLTAGDWTIYVLDNTHYLVVKDGTDLVSVKANGNVANKVVMASNITSAVFLNYSTFENNTRAVAEKFNNYIYYTRNLNETETTTFSAGNVLARVKINTSTEEKVYSLDNASTYTLTDVKNNSIYYTKAHSSLLDSTYLFKNSLTSTGALNKSNEVQLTFETYSAKYVVNINGTGNSLTYVVGYNSNDLKLITVNSTGVPSYKSLLTKSITILSLYEGKLLYLDSADANKLKYINVLAEDIEEIEVITNGKTIKTDVKNLIDFNGDTTYFFASYTGEESKTTHYYLNRTYLNTDEPKSEFVGKFNSSHIPAKPANEGLTEEDEEWEIWIK